MAAHCGPRRHGATGRPKVAEQRSILAEQEDRCAYCNWRFGSLVLDKKTMKTRPLRVEWDHVTPYSFSRSNSCEYVAACQICNQIKASFVFDTFSEAVNFVKDGRRNRYTLCEGLISWKDQSALGTDVRRNSLSSEGGDIQRNSALPPADPSITRSGGE